jgi:RimJ/RimL family protein N-acetyltransferase
VQFRLRPITPEDKAALAASWLHVSPESQRRRFLAPHPTLSNRELRYFTEVDGHDHVAFVATPVDDPSDIRGVGRWVRLRDRPTVAEFAIVVGDQEQGQGIGTALLERLIEEAQAQGITAFTADVLAENEPVRRLLGRLGRTLARVSHGPVDELEVDLAA